MKTEHQKKKPTNGQLLRRLENAVIHIDRTKDTKEIFFSDKGLRLTVTEDYVIVATGFHAHLFNRITSSGISRPYLYISRLVAAAQKYANDILVDGGYSYARLFEVLNKKKDDKDVNIEYNISIYTDWWLFNIFAPLYTIGESSAESFLVYEDYVHNIARQEVILSEKKDDLTNRGFIAKISALVSEFTDNMEEVVIFPKKTDEEVIREEVGAMQEQDLENAMEARQGDGQ